MFLSITDIKEIAVAVVWLAIGLKIPEIPMILLTDSYSVYECLVKLGSTQEKRLMIDIMALRQLYERREAHEVRWINGEDNPADAMTKASPNRSLKKLIDDNEITVRLEGWVERRPNKATAEP
ncbi:hypothetical protein LEL_03942 [Akanthomyces lecanii RCEF 1005]|uniref:Uncharacterized protein n=1 Tax=Akanthomyces lecanii RCEF 1005 TaxID=1081108 RepID=A0A168GZF5_CORDF|nr:hypothetical protein LEL_03942 [Akanthomyces lecanii RCEF 1005]